MTDLFQNKYRIPSARLRGWDYAAPAAYFVTICTHSRVCWFGDVRNAKMVLSEIGKIADEEWMKTAVIRSNVVLGEFVVMPNHIHGILIIEDQENVETSRRDVSSDQNASDNESENQNNATTQTENESGYTIESKNEKRETTHRVVSTGLGANSLGSIIGQYKSVCTKRIRKLGHPRFCWQTRFHDHIIRDEKEFFRIADYIRNNPARWAEDRYHPDNELGGE